jgi:hypothetical protein
MGYPFAATHVPALWSALLNEFGGELTYLPHGDTALAVQIQTILKDGVEPEDVFPGRYTYIDVPDSALASPPMEGDMVETPDGRTFLVERVDAIAYGFSRCVLKDSDPVL